MSNFNTKKCDSCGELKRESNHWFVVVRSSTGCCILPSDSGSLAGVTVELAEDGIEPAVEHFDACGDDCAHHMLSEWLHKAGAKPGPVPARRAV